MNNRDDVVGSEVKNASHTYKVKHWKPPPVGWLKWNTEASRLEARHTRTINYVSKDNTGRVHYSSEKMIGDYPILLAETLVIEEAVMVVIQK